jgi:nucleoredoxin
MKKIITILLTSCLAGSVFAEFETWTNQEGISVKMKLLHVDRSGESPRAKFKLENGQVTNLDPATLAEDDAQRVLDWKPTLGTEGYFHYMFDDALVVLNGSTFGAHKHNSKPVKYYAFYYTASWCPPCRTFTPVLVDFYKKHKNKNFEIILVSSDRSEDAMLEYAKKGKMPWPHVDYKKTRDISSMLNHGVRGIPALIVCDAEGNNLGNFRSNLEGLAELIK